MAINTYIKGLVVKCLSTPTATHQSSLRELVVDSSDDSDEEFTIEEVRKRYGGVFAKMIRMRKSKEELIHALMLEFVLGIKPFIRRAI